MSRRGEEIEGLHEKYLVIRRDHIIENSKVELENGTIRIEYIPSDEPGYKKLFVLSAATDPAAFIALWTYARFCFPRLSSDIKALLSAQRTHGMSLSTTGRLNLPTALQGMIRTIVGEDGD